MELDKKVIKIIEKIISNQNKKISNWKPTSKFEPLRVMDSIDDKGEVGEMLLYEILKNKFNVNWEKAKTIDDWDIEIEGIRIEVKLATMGKSSKTFQHEKFFKGRNYDAVIFLDFCPELCYITYGKKSNIVWQNIHQRSNEIVDRKTGKSKKIKIDEYKFDISLKNLENNDISGKKGKKLENSITQKINTEKDLINFTKKIVKDYKNI